MKKIDKKQITDISKTELYKKFGFKAEHYEELNKLLADENLSNLKKKNVSSEKENKISEVIERKYVRHCSRGDCKNKARNIVRVANETINVSSSKNCDVCKGSITEQRVEAMIKACLSVGLKKICIVGGFPNPLLDFKQRVGSKLSLRFINGKIARKKKDAMCDVRWAEQIVIWGRTLLDHDVSNLYSSEKNCKVVNFPNVIRLCEHIEEIAIKELKKANR